MRVKTSRTAKILISTLLFVVIIHTASHIALYGSNIPFTGNGIAELSEIKEKYVGVEIYSKVALIAEWFLILPVILIKSIKGKIDNPNSQNTSQIQNVKPLQPYSKTKTDLDILYEKLKEKKVLKVADIAKFFKVSEEVVMEWGKILEAGKMASINYPRLSKPEIVIMEKNNEEAQKSS